MTPKSPRGWANAYAHELVSDPIIYGILQPGADRADGVPYIRPTEIVEDEIQTSLLRKTSAEIALRYARSRLTEGDVLLSIVGTIGKVALVPAELAGANITQSSVRIRGLPGVVEPRFLAHLLRSPQSREQYEKAQLGTGVPRLNVAHVRELSIPLAPLNEQRRIVDKIDALFAHSKNAKASLDRIPALLDKLKRSILAAAFRGDLTKDWREAHPEVEPAEALLARIRAERRRRWEEAELARLTARGKVPGDERWKAGYEEPCHVEPTTMALPKLPPQWAWASLEELTDPVRTIRYGILMPGADVGASGVPYVKVRNMRDGKIVLDGIQHTTREIHEQYAAAQLAEADLVISIRGTWGRVAPVPPELAGGNVTQDSARIAPMPSISRDVLLQALVAPVSTRFLDKVAKGVAVRGVNIGDLRRLPIALCPAAEQSVLLDRLSSMQAQYSQIHALPLFERLQRLDRAILSQAFRGKLVPQDPTDEPASALLDRIRAARESTTPAPNAPKRPRARRAAPAATPSAAAPAEAPPPAPAPAPPTTPPIPFVELPRAAQLPLIHTALRGLGPVPGDAAVRLVADHLREHGRAEFTRLRSDGPLYATIDKAIDAAVRAELVDRPQRGHVRAIVPDAKDYTDADWRRCLEGALAERAEAEAAAPADDDALLHAAADWAVANMGLVHQRLRAGGLVHQGLSRALAAAAADTTGD